MSDGYIPTSLTYICFVACPTCYLIDATFLVVLCVICLIVFGLVFESGLFCYCVCGSVGDV